jgi:hypothetical protein
MFKEGASVRCGAAGDPRKNFSKIEGFGVDLSAVM